jgi:hypothetical protein
VGACALLVTLCLPQHSAAQFNGYYSPQTVQATLASNQHCTNAFQAYVTGSVPGFDNLGQTQHYVTVSGITGAQYLQVEIDGIDASGQSSRISDILDLAGTYSQSYRTGALVGTGYYPKIQVQVYCYPTTATYNMSYSGTSSVPDITFGAYLAARIDKVVFSGADDTLNQFETLQTPFGNSAGTLYATYTTAFTTGGTLAVTCSTAGGSTYTAYTTTLAAATGQQSFVVPAGSCPFATLTYTHGTGGAGGTITAEYVLTAPGEFVSASSVLGTVNQGSPASGANAWPVAVTEDTTHTIVDPGDATNKAVRINCVTGCAGGGGASLTDEGTFTQGTTAFAPVGGFYNSSVTNLASGQGGAVQMTATRHLMADVADPLPAGTNALGTVLPTLGSARCTQATVNFSSTGDNVVIAGVATKVIRVYLMYLVINSGGATTTVTFYDGTPAGTALTGPMTLNAGATINQPEMGDPWFTTSAGNAFVVNQSGTDQVGGWMCYAQN